MAKEKKDSCNIQQQYEALNKSAVLVSIRESLIGIIPILMLGILALVCRSFPQENYQEWVTTVFDGFIYRLFDGIYQVTYGMISIYLTISLTNKYSSYKEIQSYNSGIVFGAIVCLLILGGAMTTDTFPLDNFGPNGVFTAIICSLGAVSIYKFIWTRFRFNAKVYTDGMDTTFIRVLSSIFPISVVVLFFAILNGVFVQVAGVDCFQNWYEQVIAGLFDNMGNSFLSVFLYVLTSQILWSFGIHGSNVLIAVKEELFTSAMSVNVEALEAGGNATEIITGTFIDVFVCMGGCGATWALLIALLIFGKRKSHRSLAKMAAIPMLFNVNEMLIFGVPVVCNVVFLAPFIVVPLICTCTSYLAMLLGWVPIAANAVEWTTPIFFSGYIATGSPAGMILQMVNLIISVMIYGPFVKMYDDVIDNSTREKLQHLVDILKESEGSKKPIRLLSMKNTYGNIARNMMDELERWIRDKEVMLYYQPQYNFKRELIGAEALLRWKHPMYGDVYPPLAIKLAEETDELMELEKGIFRRIAMDMEHTLQMFEKLKHVSVNVTGTTIQKDEFEDFLIALNKEYPGVCQHILIEITEQAALRIDSLFIEKLSRLRELGYSFGIDDFSMGNTSIKYLQSNAFCMVKLDGEICKDILNNERSKEIIASIAHLTQELGIDVLAEYVETEQQRQALEEVGCYLYQGYLYSPAITMESFYDKVKDEGEA